MADTIGGLIDKLITVDTKMWNNQEILYEIRRMSFDEFKERYLSDESGSIDLWTSLSKACDLNVQRNDLIDEIDDRMVEIANPNPGSIRASNLTQKKYKTY